MVAYYKNNSKFNFLSMKDKYIQYFSCLQGMFTYTNSHLHQAYNCFPLIKFTIIETFIQLYTSISTVSHYWLSSGLYPNKALWIMWINISTTIIGSVMNHLNIILFTFNKFIIIKYVIFSSNLLLYHCFNNFHFLRDHN